MAQWVKGFVTKTGDLSLIHGIHMAAGKKRLPTSIPIVCLHAQYAHTHTYTARDRDRGERQTQTDKDRKREIQ